MDTVPTLKLIKDFIVLHSKFIQILKIFDIQNCVYDFFFSSKLFVKNML